MTEVKINYSKPIEPIDTEGLEMNAIAEAYGLQFKVTLSARAGKSYEEQAAEQIEKQLDDRAKEIRDGSWREELEKELKYNAIKIYRLRKMIEAKYEKKDKNFDAITGFKKQLRIAKDLVTEIKVELRWSKDYIPD